MYTYEDEKKRNKSDLGVFLFACLLIGSFSLHPLSASASNSYAYIVIVFFSTSYLFFLTFLCPCFCFVRVSCLAAVFLGWLVGFSLSLSFVLFPLSSPSCFSSFSSRSSMPADIFLSLLFLSSFVCIY